jgi:hypothetical protein
MLIVSSSLLLSNTLQLSAVVRSVHTITTAVYARQGEPRIPILERVVTIAMSPWGLIFGHTHNSVTASTMVILREVLPTAYADVGTC